jgi:dihydrofolate reductase
LPAATRLAITEVHARIDGDARFPAIDPKIWREIARGEQKPAAGDDVPFAFVSYERVIEAAMRRPSAA